jgi:hypothetical protein
MSMSQEDKIAKAVKDAKVLLSHGQAIEGSETDSGQLSADDPCPVTALGTLDGNYYFISPSGEVRRLSPRDFTDKFLVSIFGGRIDWLCRNFPATTRKGQKDFSRFEGSDACVALMRACHDRGLYNPNTPGRGPGVWRVGELPILHSGDAIWYQNQWLPPGQQFGGAIYSARAALERPDFNNPLTAVEAAELRQWFNAWNFVDPIDADLLFGFMGASLLGGFPLWRAHAFVIGERGSGKTKLGELMMACLGAQGMSLNNYTEAGLRQSLVNEARALCLDEGEPGSDGSTAHRMSQVIKLLRLLSGGPGARIARGSSAGVAQSYIVTGCVMVLAINPPPLEPQDRSRIIQISINKPNSTGTASQDIDHFIDVAGKRSARLRARAILGVDRFVEATKLFRQLLLDKGCDGRQADLFSTLLAGRSMLLEDTVPHPDAARSLVEQLGQRLKAIFIEDDESGDGQLCLRHFLDSACEAIRDGRRMTLGQIIAKERQAPFTHEGLLDSYGLRLMSDGTLFVPNSHTQLNRVYISTAWSGGGWRFSLMRLAGAKPSRHPVRVGGLKIRGLLIPPDLLPALDPDPPEPP